MITMFNAFIHAFFYDELAVKRWIRGALTAVVPIGVQLMADANWTTWTVKQWALHAIPSAFAFAAGSMQSSAKKNGNGNS